MAAAQDDLQNDARAAGLRFATYSPGDGVTRYRFFREEDKSSYFGPSNGVYTALGIREARTWLAGVLRGRVLENPQHL